MFVDSIDLRQSVQAGGMGNDVMESICNFDIFFLQMYVFRWTHQIKYDLCDLSLGRLHSAGRLYICVRVYRGLFSPCEMCYYWLI